MDNENAVAFPVPVIDETNAPYWESLRRDQLSFQQCNSCDNKWLPARSECPKCLSPDIKWKAASGHARLISWVVYHKAFHPSFADRLPYNVAIVELNEGPRLISNILDLADPSELAIEMPLQLVVRDEHGVAIPAFRKANT
mgnify:CR=1 FL=1|tara:strand:- start:146576 stop:146998 length:423 start_codon:yes stop_codon:yes gene_type:complete